MRGYSTDTIDTLEESSYRQDVSEEQLASYGPVTQNAVRRGDAAALSEALACGLLPNACNQYGESLLHLCCRRGNKQLLDVMINHGVVLQIIDDYGRTPLHDAFWAPSPAFDVAETLIQEDRGMLFMSDRRGFSPLEYTHLEDWEEWKEWLDQKIDAFFPLIEKSEDETKIDGIASPSSQTNPRPHYDRNVISAELMRMVSHGKIKPSEALLLSADEDEGDEDELWDDDEDNSTHFGTECAYLAESTLGSFSSSGSFTSSGNLEEDNSDFDADRDEDDSSYCSVEQVEILEIMRVAAMASKRHARLARLPSVMRLDQ